MSTNYAAHIFDDEARFKSYVRQAHDKDSEDRVAEVYLRLRNSVKFRSPANGVILDLPHGDQSSVIIEFGQRLPYPCIAIEYTMDRKHTVSAGQQPVTKRVLVAWEVENFALGHQLHIQMHLFYYDPGNGMWMPSLMGILFTPDGKWVGVPLLNNIPEDMQRTIYDESVGDWQPLIELMAALACKNVAIDDGELPPAQLNAARSKRGKMPFFTYKTLTIDSAGVNPSREAGGTHASPRIHLRRGHIRRLPKGPIWVNAAVVGDKSRGMVVKDYAVH